MHEPYIFSSKLFLFLFLLWLVVASISSYITWKKRIWKPPRLNVKNVLIEDTFDLYIHCTENKLFTVYSLYLLNSLFQIFPVKLPFIWNQRKETRWPCPTSQEATKGKCHFSCTPPFFFWATLFSIGYLSVFEFGKVIGTHGPVSSWMLDISLLAWVRRMQREAWERRMSEWVKKNSLSPSSSVFSSIQLPLLISLPSHSVHICLTETFLSGSFSPRLYIFVFLISFNHSLPHWYK